jgi:hypothetical protein
VLRVLANILAVPGIEYDSAEEIRDALKAVCDAVPALPKGAAATTDLASLADAGAGHGGAAQVSAVHAGAALAAAPSGRWVDIPPYQVDVLVRGSDALARTKDGHVTREAI